MRIKISVIIFVLALFGTGVVYAAGTPTGTITSPEANAITFGNVELAATYDDGDDINDDIVQWAVREGTCSAGTNTVVGNVDGFNDPYTWDGADFSAMFDATSLDAGLYCFIFNPKDDAGEPDVRETQLFYIVQDYVHGGGHALEEMGSKRKNWLDFSFGGIVGDAGSAGLIGTWQVNLHNVGADLDKSKFHMDTVTDLNFFASNSATCTSAVNFTGWGRWNKEEGSKITFRAGDTDDTVRIEIWDSSNVKVYDSNSTGEFPAESSCVGTARTGLDNGNITINF
ncbi:MAG: hypothetical protein ABH833_03225 [Parcubacteria group bacterium]